MNLRIKLLSLYTKSGRVNEAYEHAIKVENTGAHRASIKWYKFLTEVFEVCSLNVEEVFQNKNKYFASNSKKSVKIGLSE